MTVPDRKHRFERVTGTPFRYVCFHCAQHKQSDHDVTWADLNGPAFKAYYCEPCKTVVLAKDTEVWLKSIGAIR